MSEAKPVRSLETQCMEWTLTHATKNGEIQEQDAKTANVAWIEVEQAGGSEAEKFAKFRKNLCMKFGPAKGASLNDKILKYYNHVKHSIEQKKLEHREKQQQQLLLQEQQQKQNLIQQAHQQIQSRQQIMPTQPPSAQSSSLIPPSQRPPSAYTNPIAPIMPQQQQFRPHQFQPSASAQLKDPFKTAGSVAYMPPSSFSSSSSSGMHPQYHSGPHLINQNISQDYLQQMEKVNYVAENIDVMSMPRNDENGRRFMSSLLTAPLYPELKEFILGEISFSKNELWNSVQTTSSGATTDNNDLAHTEDLNSRWRTLNVADAAILLRALKTSLSKEGMKISVGAVAALSNGIQLYSKNLVESALEVRSNRHNESSRKAYNALQRMIYRGKGEPLPENQSNIAIKWDALQTKNVLEQEMLNGNNAVVNYNTTDEKDLIREMRSYDEAYGQYLAAKRKAHMQQTSFSFGGTSSPAPFVEDTTATWWNKEDLAENTGVLDWFELSQLHFKSRIAEKFNMGPFNPTNSVGIVSNSTNMNNTTSRKRSRIALTSTSASTSSSNLLSASAMNKSDNKNEIEPSASDLFNANVSTSIPSITRDDVFTAISNHAPSFANTNSKFAMKYDIADADFSLRVSTGKNTIR